MSETAERDDPALWEKVKAKVTAGAKGGRKGEWSARKAQLAVAEYKKAGGGYVGEKDEDNSLHQWTEEEWGTRSGKGRGMGHAVGQGEPGVRRALSTEEGARGLVQGGV